MQEFDENEALYRITSLEGFISLLFGKKERFVQPIECWDDTYEGLTLHLLDSDEWVQRTIEQIYFGIANRDAFTTIANYLKIQRSRYAVYGSCWSTQRDSDALWRIYSYDKKAIQLRSTGKRIANLLKNSGWEPNDFEIRKIQYGPYSKDFDNEIDRNIKLGAKVYEPYFHKREAFQHEEEVRILLDNNKQFKEIESFVTQALYQNYAHFSDSSTSETERIYKTISSFGLSEYYKKHSAKAINVDVESLDEYLLGIRVHPLAADWYVTLIKTICDKYSIPFEGKSDLYKKLI